MIDIHAHILPDIDDGSESMAMTMEMLALSAESGVTDIVATPHVNMPGMYGNYASPELKALFKSVAETAERSGIQIRLHRGMELFATPDLPRLLTDGRVWTINRTKYFLTEFSFDEDPYFCREMLDRCLRRGFRPVIAHPERYYFVQEYPEIAYDWCVSGCVLQVNKGSLLGRFGRREEELGRAILSHGLAACVASDAHRPDRRSTYMRTVQSFLRREVGDQYAQILLEENPRRILQGRGLRGPEPIPF